MMGVKLSTVYAWLSRKELRGSKVGHRRYITKQQLKEFNEQRRTGEYTDYTYAPK
jgi:excisionase family DNA binding protein